MSDDEVRTLRIGDLVFHPASNCGGQVIRISPSRRKWPILVQHSLNPNDVKSYPVEELLWERMKDQKRLPCRIEGADGKQR